MLVFRKEPTVDYVNITWHFKESIYDLQGSPERIQWILSKRNGVFHVTTNLWKILL